MKYIQTRILKILLIISIVFSGYTVYPQNFSSKLAQADSLFSLKRYTQSFEIYNALLNVNQYSPAMLLRMAYIQEGLGSISKSLYYLNLYYLSTGDEQALTKMEELAQKNRLEGYQYLNQDKLYYYASKYGNYFSFAFASLAILSIAFMFYKKRKGSRPIGIAVLSLIFIILLSINVNFPLKDNSVIVTSSNTYLMNGPSAGASVVSIIDEGHKLRLIKKKDVWLEVEWADKTVYIKENRVVQVSL
jgi:hypothetical protein